MVPRLPAFGKGYKGTYKTKTAAIYGKDDRQPINLIDGSDATSYPYRAVGRLTWTGGETICSGALISECHVLTSGHCFFGPRDQEARNLKFYHLNTTSGFPMHDQSTNFKLENVRWGLVGEGGENSKKALNKRGDWAVLKLEKNIGRTLGYFAVTEDSLAPFVRNKQNLHSAGFHIDSKCANLSQPCVQNNVRVTGIDKGIVSTNADAFKGGSGGPMWVNNKETGFAIIRALTHATPVDMSKKVRVKTDKGDMVQKVPQQVTFDKLPKDKGLHTKAIDISTFINSLVNATNQIPCNPNEAQ